MHKNLLSDSDCKAVFNVSEGGAVKVDHKSPLPAFVGNKEELDMKPVAWRQIWKAENDTKQKK